MQSDLVYFPFFSSQFIFFESNPLNRGFCKKVPYLSRTLNQFIWIQDNLPKILLHFPAKTNEMPQK
jgi:hypothetical protein